MAPKAFKEMLAHIKGSLSHRRLGLHGHGSGGAAVSYSDLTGDNFSSFPQVLAVLLAMAMGE